MSFDFDAIVPEIARALKPLFQATYEAGGADTLAALMEAVKATAGTTAATTATANRSGMVEQDVLRNPVQRIDAVYRLATQRNGKAPRGLVPKVVRSVMAGKPFMSVPSIEDRVLEVEPRISRKSVGNELRRMEGVVYERDVPGGYHWKLIGQKDEAEGGDETKPSASNFNFNQGGADGTTLAVAH